MPGNPSYYFTLFKKFQILNHVPSDSVHGAPVNPTGGFDLKTATGPHSPFGAANIGNLLNLGSPNPSDSPLWAILNSRINNPGFTPVNVAGFNWPTMPPGTPPAWQEFQLNPAANKLVDVFGNWIQNSRQNDTPIAVINSPNQASVQPPLAAGVSLFVCSMPQDNGIRPDAVPNNFWATSLIFLVDPTNGNTVFPATLTGGSDYFLVAVIGNRGDTNAGRFINHPPAVEAAASVMVWNSGLSPGVQLPSLSNLDVNDKNGIYEQYFLKPGQYDVVGFRLNVQTVFDGIVKAVATNTGCGEQTPCASLGGKSPQDWVKDPQQGAHLCAKVVVREHGGSFPNLGDSPVDNARVAQKNLAPFDINTTVVSPDPNINWKNFMVGQPLFLRLPGAGRNTLSLHAGLPHEAFRLYIGIPTETFERFFHEGRGGGFKGFKVVPHHELCEGKLGERAKPFPEAVVLQYLGKENALEIPPLGEEESLGMSLGIEYSVRRLKKLGTIGEVTLVHKALIPKLRPGTLCFEIEEVIAGGFTIVVRAEDPRRGPKG